MSAVERPAPVVVAVDGSTRSAGAVRYAVGEARRRGSGVRVVHVVPAPLPEGGLWPAQAGDVTYLERSGTETVRREVAAIRAVAPGTEVEPVVAAGPRVARLVEAAATGGLMVLGRETRHGVERLVTGTTTADVAARAAVPVVVVPARWQDGGHGRVVVGVKTLAGADELLAHAFAEAAARHAVLRVVHAVEIPGLATDLGVADAYVGESVENASRLLRRLVDDWSAVHPAVEVETRVVQGLPDKVLAEAAADADVLVVARHRRGLRHPVRLGSTPRAVLGTCDTPVEILPLPGEPTAMPLVLESDGEVLKD
ncbi:universal stress protein [Promicromonospora sp. NPDC050880]|uniref:universal stress protein n=1 Tax=Promicromonospora sp. NPDC050880 TaxID=3364406 RepID=UPI003787D91F